MINIKYKVKRVLECLHLSAEYNAGRAGKNKVGKDSLPIEKIDNNFQLISLHIPKSGGTSFYKTLRGVYGKDTVARVDYKPHLKKLLVNKREFVKDAFPDNIKVIHGHIRHNALEKYINLSKDVKIITWLRNPVERIISDYYYVISMLNERYRFDPYNPYILKRITKSLLEFAAMEAEQNRISRFLGDIKPEELYFVGILEYFEEDLEHLSKRLNWKSYATANVNKTKNKSHNISEEVIEKIRELNRKDMDLYEKALSIRNNRIKHLKND